MEQVRGQPSRRPELTCPLYFIFGERQDKNKTGPFNNKSPESPTVTHTKPQLLTDLARRLTHVRWIAGGTGAGKTTLTRTLADRYDVLVYDGDRAERDYAHRCTPRDQPRLWDLVHTPSVRKWNGRTAQEIFESMPSLHGETFGFVVDDLLALPTQRTVLVDDFRTLPRDVLPLLTWREQVVFLLPAPQFRHQALGTRFSDPVRARANWGDSNHDEAFALRLARDELWDAEVQRQALELDLPTLAIDGSRDIDNLAEDLAGSFRLTRRTTPPTATQPTERPSPHTSAPTHSGLTAFALPTVDRGGPG